MKPSRYSAAYNCFLELLRQARHESGLTQVELAQALGLPQSYVSKCEIGERRLDVLEARAWILALGGSPAAFVEALDEALAKGSYSNITLPHAHSSPPRKRRPVSRARSEAPRSRSGG